MKLDHRRSPARAFGFQKARGGRNDLVCCFRGALGGAGVTVGGDSSPTCRRGTGSEEETEAEHGCSSCSASRVESAGVRSDSSTSHPCEDVIVPGLGSALLVKLQTCFHQPLEV